MNINLDRIESRSSHTPINRAVDEYPPSPRSGEGNHTAGSHLRSTSWKHLASTLSENFNAALTNVLVSIPSMLHLVVVINYHTPSSETVHSQTALTTLFLGYVMSLLIHGNQGIFKSFTSSQAFILMVQIDDFGVSSIPATTCLAGAIYLMLFAVKAHKSLKSVPACVLYGLQMCTAFSMISREISHSLGLPPNPKGNRDLVTVGMHVAENYKKINLVVILLFTISTIALVILMKWKKKYMWHTLFFVIFLIIGLLNASRFSILDYKLLGQDWGVNGHFHDHFVRYFKDKLKFEFSFVRVVTEPGFVINSIALALVTLLETSVLLQLVEFHCKVHLDHRAEFLGVGVANIISGLLGLLPVSLPISKNILGIRAGAQDFTYPVMCMILFIIFTYLFWPFMRYLPVLLIAVFNVSLSFYLIELPRVVSYWRYSKRFAIIFTLMVISSLFINMFLSGLLAMTAFLILYIRTVPDVDSFGSGDIDKIREQAEIFRTKNENNPSFALSQQRSSLIGIGEEEVPLAPPPLAMIREALVRISTEGIVYQLRGRFSFTHYKTHLANIRHFAKSPVLLDFSKIFSHDAEFIAQYTKLIRALGSETSLYVTGIPYERVVNDRMLSNTWVEKLYKDNQLIFIN